MRKSMPEIWSLVTERRAKANPWQSIAEQVRQTYNGDVVVPLPELDEVERAAVANLLQTGMDGLAKRIASTLPSIYFPPARVGVKKEINAAHLREHVTKGWWEQNRMNLKLRRRALHLIGYGTSPVLVYPDMKGEPCWHVRNPLTAYPGPRVDEDEMVPPDCAFLVKRTRASLERDYPQQMYRLSKASASVFDLVEYVSADQYTLFVKGAEADTYTPATGSPFELLHDFDNHTGQPWVIVPGRITLDRIIGQFDGMVGMYHMQAKMNALYMNAVQRSIFPDTWVVSPQQGQAKVVTQADGLQGIVGEVEGADIKILQANPGAYTSVAVDRLEAAARDTGVVPSELQGRSGTNIRTDKRGNSVLAAAIDFNIQEAQEIFEESLSQEDRIAFSISKAYGGSRTFSLYVRDIGEVEYVPDRDLSTDVHQVRYKYAGADAEQLGVLGAQKVGAGLMSKQTAMEMDPAVADTRVELHKMTVEQLRQALLASLLTMAQDPNAQVDPVAFAHLVQDIATDKAEIEDAVIGLHQEMQKQQAAQAQAQQAQAGQPPGAPAQPGLNATPEQGPIGAPPIGLDHLRSLVRDIHGTANPAAA